MLRALILVFAFSTASFADQEPSIVCKAKLFKGEKMEMQSDVLLTEKSEFQREKAAIKDFSVWIGRNACRLDKTDRIGVGCSVMKGYSIRITNAEITAELMHRADWDHPAVLTLSSKNHKLELECTQGKSAP